MATANPFFLKQTQFYKVFPVDVLKVMGEYLMKHENRTPTPTARIMDNALCAVWGIDYYMERFPIGCNVIIDMRTFTQAQMVNPEYTVTNIYPHVWRYENGRCFIFWYAKLQRDTLVTSMDVDGLRRVYHL